MSSSLLFGRALCQYVLKGVLLEHSFQALGHADVCDPGNNLFAGLAAEHYIPPKRALGLTLKQEQLEDLRAMYKPL